jgi:hypothetical protein
MQPDPLTWQDVAKSAIGPFIGAALAFLANEVNRYRTERRDRVAVGNMALFTLRQQLADLYSYRAVIRRELVIFLERAPDAPDWALLRPKLFQWSENSEFDRSGLAFLMMAASGKQAMQLLADAERRYGAARSGYEAGMKAVRDLHARTSELERDGRDATWDEMRRYAGPALVSACEGIFNSTLARLDDDIDGHRAALAALRRALKQQLGSGVWDGTTAPPPGEGDDSLPPLPPRVARLRRFPAKGG